LADSANRPELAEVLRAAGCSSSSNSDDLFWRAAAGVGGGDSPKSDMVGYAARVRDEGAQERRLASKGRAETRQDTTILVQGRNGQERPGPPSSALSRPGAATPITLVRALTSPPPPFDAKLQQPSHTSEPLLHRTLVEHGPTTAGTLLGALTCWMVVSSAYFHRILQLGQPSMPDSS
jgi:hypothetical protein